MAADKKKDEKRPIIKKVKKVAGHGHHGGAWKVAYADFVTAMMAFFLLLWLLSTSSKATLEGLAEFFTPTEGIKDAQGIGFKGGIAESEVGTVQKNMSKPGLVVGHSMEQSTSDNSQSNDKESTLFKQSAAEIEKKFSQDEALKAYQDNVTAKMTPDGLQIDVMDSDKTGIFERGTAKLTESGKTILGALIPTIKRIPNYISIAGHTDASPTEAGQADYTNWELSSDRAQTVRRFLVNGGMEAERPKKVLGMADRELYAPKEPRSPKNRRMAITLLKGSHILIPDAAVPKGAEEQPAAASAPAAAPTAPVAAPPAPGGH